jgi:hypothetical protein
MSALASPLSRRTSPLPADGLLHPLALVALATLLVNDHVLKSAFPGWWTGKLSDLAALVVLALVIQAIAELLGAAIHPRVLAASLLASGATLIAIKLLPAAAELYRVSLGLAQWMPAAVAAWLAGGTTPAVVPVALTRDASDVLALPVLWLAWVVFRRRRA